MPWKPDLHLHTLASDGRLTAETLAERAAGHGVNLMAVTDHDTLSALPAARAAAEARGMAFIPGIEISAAGEDEVHILGYFVDDSMKELNRLIAAMREDRLQREVKYLSRLKELGMDISHEDIPLPEGTAFSRPALARAMVVKGYARDVSDAFERYLSVGRIAYIPRLNVPVACVVKILRSHGAVPVLAHPGKTRCISQQALPAVPKEWLDAGLMGIEAYHPSHTLSQSQAWEHYAGSIGLLVTGGSDFHDKADREHGETGQMLAHWLNASSDANALLAFTPERPTV